MDACWINTKERLPAPDINVLVSFENNMGEICVVTAYRTNLKVCAHSDRRVSKWFMSFTGGRMIRDVTHWCHLPAIEGKAAVV